MFCIDLPEWKQNVSKLSTMTVSKYMSFEKRLDSKQEWSLFKGNEKDLFEKGKEGMRLNSRWQRKSRTTTGKFAAGYMDNGSQFIYQPLHSATWTNTVNLILFHLSSLYPWAVCILLPHKRKKKKMQANVQPRCSYNVLKQILQDSHLVYSFYFLSPNLMQPLAKYAFKRCHQK